MTAESRQANEKSFRKTVNHTFIWLFIYEAVILLVILLIPGYGGMAEIFSVSGGCAFVFLCNAWRWPIRDLAGGGREKMSPSRFLWLLFTLMGVQLLCILLISLVRRLGLNPTTLGNATGQESFPDLLYGCLFAPVCEELIFRGFMIGTLRRYGRVFSVLLAALFFGLMHMNLGQIIAGSLIGLVLGYVYIVYGLKWCILLHSLNNAVLSYFLLWVERTAGNTVGALADLLLIVGGTAAIIHLFRHRSRIAGSFLSDPGTHAEKGTFFRLLGCIWFWVNLLLMVLMTVMVSNMLY